MKILITGGNGYIGRSLATSLSSLYDVSLITRSIVDLTNKNQTKKFFEQHCKNAGLFDWVIHSAVEGGSRLKSDEDSVLKNNLKMYYNLLDNKQFYNRFISFGSGAEILYTDTPYGFSKKIIADSMSEKNGFYNIRIYGVFDENELPTRFIKSNILKYIKKQPMEIYSDKAMDFFYMEDLKNLINYYLNNKNLPNTIACIYPNTYRLSKIANIINQLDKYKVKIINFQKDELDYSVLKNDSCNFAYNIIKCIGLESGIEKTYKNLK